MIEIVPPLHGNPDEMHGSAGVGGRWRSSSFPTGSDHGDALPDGVRPGRPADEHRPGSWRSTPICAAPPACTSSSTSIPAKLVKGGIAEQNMIAMAAGLSQEGYIPFPCTFDAFCRRFMDQLYVSVAYSNLNVKVLGAYVGLFTGKAGATHQSDKELGLLLRDPEPDGDRAGLQRGDARRRCASAWRRTGPFYLRIVRCEVEDNEIVRRLPVPARQGRDGLRRGHRRRARDDRAT